MLFAKNERSDTWATDQIPNMQQIWVLKELATHPKELSKVIICKTKKKTLQMPFSFKYR